MTKRMLIDATHAEETRVVVLDGNRLEDFDVETSTKKQLKGNIYLAKVVRVEPSLQAAFVEYGGNRHGFLAFGEIHPDYYQIPVADRQRLIEAQAEAAREEEAAEDRAAEAEAAGHPIPPRIAAPEAAEPDEQPESAAEVPAESETPVQEAPTAAEPADDQQSETAQPALIVQDVVHGEAIDHAPDAEAAAPEEAPSPAGVTDEPAAEEAHSDVVGIDTVPADAPPPETVGGDSDAGDDAQDRRIPPRFLRNYKIQEVIKRRQIMLIQVVKEERGTKGAALTTYLSLAGRFCVLMPNSPRGGGISRKITSAADRRRLKEITTELEIPKGMGLIVRTAGAARPKPEIKRDCEYLLRLWDDIREQTMKSSAPALIYEEASLIKRAIRDVYSRDVDEILVDGEDGWKAARDFMRMLMPAHAKKVQLHRDSVPLFAKNQVDAQLDAMLSPTVQLKSGGYLVINQAEALVAIDVNSGRSTRERGIEETALRTNLEAADEVARQLRLRDLAGLIVIDFIDMEAKKHNAMVERRLKEALKNDRARIQIGHISHFGLLEMSRQRLRPSLAETSFVTCAHCNGIGLVRSTESAALHVLRHIEEEGAKRRSAEILVYVATPIAMYILNNKRDRLLGIEARYGMRVLFSGDDALLPPEIRIDRVRALLPGEGPPAIAAAEMPPRDATPPLIEADELEADDIVEEDGPETEDDDAGADSSRPVPGETAEEGERRRRRRRRRRRGGRRDDGTLSELAVPGAPQPDLGDPSMVVAPADGPVEHIEGVPEHAEPPTDGFSADAPVVDGDGVPRARRRGRRGGRRRRREDGTPQTPQAAFDADPFDPAETGLEPEPPGMPAYSGPTPADPFARQGYDIFDVMDQAERQAEATAIAPAIVTPAAPPPAEAAATPAPEQAPEPEAEPAAVAAAPAPEPLLPANDPEPEPAIKPIVIGADTPTADKKRGWWRR